MVESARCVERRARVSAGELVLERRPKSHTDSIVPALSPADRRRPKTFAPTPAMTPVCGVCPTSDAYYGASVEFWTTTSLSGEEIHRTGLDLVSQLSSAVDVKMKAQGLTRGTVGQRFPAPCLMIRGTTTQNTDAGKAKLLADLNLKVAAVQAYDFRNTLAFCPRPRSRFAAYRPTQRRARRGKYYEDGSLDGSASVGAYYINLRDTAEVPSWSLPTLTYHEAIPGHHLQGSMRRRRAPLPLIRKLSFFAAYIEGWATLCRTTRRGNGHVCRRSPG